MNWRGVRVLWHPAYHLPTRPNLSISQDLPDVGIKLFLIDSPLDPPSRERPPPTPFSFGGPPPPREPPAAEERSKASAEAEGDEYEGGTEGRGLCAVGPNASLMPPSHITSDIQVGGRGGRGEAT